MRYVVEDFPQGPRVRDNKLGPTFGQYITGISLTQAHIIAWALNAVADGRKLLAFDWDDHGDGSHDRPSLRYRGPTDGVAAAD